MSDIASILAQFNASSKQKAEAAAAPKAEDKKTGIMVGGTFIPLAPSAAETKAPEFKPFYLGGTLIGSYEKKASEQKNSQDPGLGKNSVTAEPQGASLRAAVSASASAGSSTIPAVKTSTIDNILFDQDLFPEELLYELLYEDISGQELISISRSDIINGQKILYQPIKNLSSIQQQYNPNNILSLQQTSNTYFAGFSINLEDKIPNEGNGLNGETVYIDSAGELIIELINLNPDEQVEIQIALSGTIYEANLGDYTS
jgi:hypothetical protein